MQSIWKVKACENSGVLVTFVDLLATLFLISLGYINKSLSKVQILIKYMIIQPPYSIRFDLFISALLCKRWWAFNIKMFLILLESYFYNDIFCVKFYAKKSQLNLYHSSIEVQKFRAIFSCCLFPVRINKNYKTVVRMQLDPARVDKPI